MPQQPLRLPTPLDLARVRPRRAQPPPPRNRRQTEIGKERPRPGTARDLGEAIVALAAKVRQRYGDDRARVPEPPFRR
jgi:hypothetical protein